MSDYWIVFIPVNPNVQPTPDAAKRACEMLKNFLPEAESVSSEFVDQIVFVDAGQNWSGVCCPVCSADAAGWWIDAMDAAAQQNFIDLRVKTPCCGAETSLHTLNYLWPVGFAKFWIEAKNPNVPTTTGEQEQQLANSLGMPVRKILRRL